MNFVIHATEYVDECPVCEARLKPYTATIKKVTMETREQPAEYVIYLHQPCPECGAEGEV